MSNYKIRSALENHLKATPNIPKLIWENTNVKPIEGEAEIEVYVKFAEPSDVGTAGYIQRGYMQLNLRYPTNTGPKAAEEMGEILRARFPLASSYVKDDVIVNIDRTPEVSNGVIADGDYVVKVFVQFYSHIID